MARLLTMPELAAAAGEATLDEWVVPEGGAFAAGDLIATVETDKAVAEIPADVEGVMVRQLIPNGTLVPVGAPIAVLGEPGEAVDVSDFLAQQGVADVVATEPQPAAPTTDQAPVAQVPASGPARSAQGDAASAPPKGDRLFISPLARRLAKNAGLAAKEITGSGPRGRITKRDVEAAIAGRDAAPASATTTSRTATTGARGQQVAAQPTTAIAADYGYEEIPHDRMRRAIAGRLTASKQQAPHFYVKATLQVDQLLNLRTRLNELSDQRISVNDLVVKAAGVALVRVPDLNVTWHEDVVRRYEHADVGLAVATERGLMTPVVRSVDTLGLSALAARSAELRQRADDGRLAQSDLEGGALCVSNLGMFGVEEFMAIINPPQAAILAVGGIRESVVVRDGATAVAKVMTVVLSVDHRPVDGVVAARWLREFSALVEHPERMLL